MANIDQNYDGSTKLRDWYPKVKSNFSAINTQVDEIATNAALIQNSDGGFSAGNNAEAETGGAVGASAGTLLGGSVGNNAHSSSGGAVGYAAITTTGGAVGQGTHSEDGGVMGYWAQAKSGGAIGAEAEADTGGAVGRKAWTGNGGAVGYLAYAANGGGSVGSNANSDAGGAVGTNAKAGAGFAGGSGAKAVDSSNNGIDAIQLGTGTNNTPKTLQVYGHQLLDATGKIPDARLNDAPSDSNTYARKDGSWEELTDLHTHTNKSILDATEVAYTESDQARIGTLESDLDGLYAQVGELESAALSDAPSDGNTYARKDGAWTSLTSSPNNNENQLINFIGVSLDNYGKDNTNLDDLPNGITIVEWNDNAYAGGYMVMTSVYYSGSAPYSGYQIKIERTGMSYRSNTSGTWGAWSKIS